MNMIEKSVRQFHEAWDLRDPDRGAAIIAPNCRFKDVARDEAQIGPDDYRMDYQRWRAAFPDGEVKVVNVLTGGETRAYRPGDSYDIPGGVEHGARIRAGTIVVDVFAEPDRYPLKAR